MRESTRREPGRLTHRPGEHFTCQSNVPRFPLERDDFSLSIIPL
jgi:hypothetical protein